MIARPVRLLLRRLAIAALLVLAGQAAGAAPPDQVLRLPPGLPPPPPPPLAVSAAPRAPVRRIGRMAPPVVHAPIRPLPGHPPPRPAPPAVPARPEIGPVTGLKLPRFASLRSDEVDLRAGPGFRYPIRWVYRRLGLPVEIESEFSVWRKVRLPDGARGWMHEATLSSRRTGLVIGARHDLRRRPSNAAAAVAIVQPGVVLRLLRCDAGAPWCRVAVAGFRGWLRRADFWGSFPGEAVRGQ